VDVFIYFFCLLFLWLLRVDVFFFIFYLCMVVCFVGVAGASCTVEECADYLSDGVK